MDTNIKKNAAKRTSLGKTTETHLNSSPVYFFTIPGQVSPSKSNCCTPIFQEFSQVCLCFLPLLFSHQATEPPRRRGLRRVGWIWRCWGARTYVNWGLAWWRPPRSSTGRRCLRSVRGCDSKIPSSRTKVAPPESRNVLVGLPQGPSRALKGYILWGDRLILFHGQVKNTTSSIESLASKPGRRSVPAFFA